MGLTCGEAGGGTNAERHTPRSTLPPNQLGLDERNANAGDPINNRCQSYFIFLRRARLTYGEAGGGTNADTHKPRSTLPPNQLGLNKRNDIEQGIFVPGGVVPALTHDRAVGGANAGGPVNKEAHYGMFFSENKNYSG